MALYRPQEENEYNNEGIITSSDDSCDNEEQQQIEVEGRDFKTTVYSNDDNQKDKEKAYGIDLDLFGRFAPQKIPKKYGKPIYHYHVEPSIRDLKYIWHEMQCKEMNVKHLDSQYSIMSFIGDEQHKTNYNLITRRKIWPICFQNKMYETIPFKYNLEDCNKYFKIAIILVMGGKFSIAIYHGKDIIYHRCERAYVVRNNRNGKRELNFIGKKAKCNRGSAGSQKRAWNEMHHKEHIQEILSKTQEMLMECTSIFIHAPSAYNKIALFGDKSEQQFLYPHNENLSRQRLKQIQVKNTNKAVNKYRLNKSDPRISSVPITISQATFTENQRVHHWLSCCWLNC